MPRKDMCPKEVLPDPIYGSTVVASLLTGLCWMGRRALPKGSVMELLIS